MLCNVIREERKERKPKGKGKKRMTTVAPSSLTPSSSSSSSSVPSSSTPDDSSSVNQPQQPSGGESMLTDPNAILAHYRRLQSESTTLSTKLGELEQEVNEHTIVLDKIKPLDPDRIGYRLIGGVLVEKPLKEIIPAVEQNEVGIRAVVKQLGQRLEAKESETRAWKEKYNIRLQTEKEVRDSQDKANKMMMNDSGDEGTGAQQKGIL